MNTGIFADDSLPDDIEAHNYQIAKIKETKRRKDVEKIRRETWQIQYDEDKKECEENQERIKKILKSRGIELRIWSCGCCPLEFTVKIDGEIKYDIGFHDDDNFIMFEKEEE